MLPTNFFIIILQHNDIKCFFTESLPKFCFKIDKIKEDATKSVNFDLTTLPEAQSKIYKIPLKIEYVFLIESDHF